MNIKKGDFVRIGKEIGKVKEIIQKEEGKALARQCLLIDTLTSKDILIEQKEITTSNPNPILLLRNGDIVNDKIILGVIQEKDSILIIFRDQTGYNISVCAEDNEFIIKKIILKEAYNTYLMDYKELFNL